MSWFARPQPRPRNGQKMNLASLCVILLVFVCPLIAIFVAQGKTHLAWAAALYAVPGFLAGCLGAALILKLQNISLRRRSRGSAWIEAGTYLLAYPVILFGTPSATGMLTEWSIDLLGIATGHR
jgi:hypothetical protein